MDQAALLITAIVALITALGGGVAWVAAKITSQTARFDRMEERYMALQRENGLLLVKMEKFRLAFQIVAAEIASSNPGSTALVHARALLAESFVFPSGPQAKTPPDMERAIDEIDKGGLPK